MLSIKCFDALPQAHAWGAGPSSIWPAICFLGRSRCHRFFCLFLNENHELSWSNSRKIDLHRQCWHTHGLLPCWHPTKFAGVTY